MSRQLAPVETRRPVRLNRFAGAFSGRGGISAVQTAAKRRVL